MRDCAPVSIWAFFIGVLLVMWTKYLRDEVQPQPEHVMNDPWRDKYTIDTRLVYSPELPWKPLAYYSLGFPRPEEGAKTQLGTLGQILLRLIAPVPTAYDNATWVTTPQCQEQHNGTLDYTAEELDTLRRAARDNYRLDLHVDGMPVVVADPNQASRLVWGVPIGWFVNDAFVLYNHLDLHIYLTVYGEVVRVIGYPLSTASVPDLCGIPATLAVNPGTLVRWTYRTATYVDKDARAASRWDWYNSQVSQNYLTEGLVPVVLLIEGIVALLLTAGMSVLIIKVHQRRYDVTGTMAGLSRVAVGGQLSVPLLPVKARSSTSSDAESTACEMTEVPGSTMWGKDADVEAASLPDSGTLLPAQQQQQRQSPAPDLDDRDPASDMTAKDVLVQYRAQILGKPAWNMALSALIALGAQWAFAVAVGLLGTVLFGSRHDFAWQPLVLLLLYISGFLGGVIGIHVYIQFNFNKAREDTAESYIGLAMRYHHNARHLLMTLIAAPTTFIVALFIWFSARQAAILPPVQVFLLSVFVLLLGMVQCLIVAVGVWAGQHGCRVILQNASDDSTAVHDRALENVAGCCTRAGAFGATVLFSVLTLGLGGAFVFVTLLDTMWSQYPTNVVGGALLVLILMWTLSSCEYTLLITYYKITVFKLVYWWWECFWTGAAPVGALWVWGLVYTFTTQDFADDLTRLYAFVVICAMASVLACIMGSLGVLCTSLFLRFHVYRDIRHE